MSLVGCKFEYEPTPNGIRSDCSYFQLKKALSVKQYATYLIPISTLVFTGSQYTMEYPIAHTTLLKLVEEHPRYASVLHHIGIPFYLYPKQSLSEICKARRWNLSTIVKQLEKASQAGGLWQLDRWGRLQHGIPHSGAGLREYPVHAIITYLKHSHGLFIRQQLPYMLDLISNIEEAHFDCQETAKDLKFVFPLFVNDFIHHIHEEEDTVFSHILQLERLLEKMPKGSISSLYYHLEKYRIEEFAVEHLEDDDEMSGIRQITHSYRITGNSSVHTKVIYQALQDFEDILSAHAKIENDILMPKAQKLEERAKGLVKQISMLN